MNDLLFYHLLGAGAVAAVIGLIWIQRIADLEGGDDPWRFRRD
jgi:hypothetical protein